MGLVAAFQAQPNTDQRKEALLELMSRSFYSTRWYPSPSLQRYCVTLAVTLEESIEKDLHRVNEQHEAYDPVEPDEDFEPMKAGTDEAIKQAIEEAISVLPFAVTHNRRNSSTMMIHVRDLWGDEFPVWVQSDASAKDLAKVARGLQLYDVDLLFKGRILDTGSWA